MGRLQAHVVRKEASDVGWVHISTGLFLFSFYLSLDSPWGHNERCSTSMLILAYLSQVLFCISMTTEGVITARSLQNQEYKQSLDRKKHKTQDTKTKAWMTFSIFLKILFFLKFSVCVCICTWVYANKCGFPCNKKASIVSPGARSMGCCEQPHTGEENWTSGLWKNTKSSPPSCFSSPEIGAMKRRDQCRFLHSLFLF